MKLTDREIIEALKAGKTIKDCFGNRYVFTNTLNLVRLTGDGLTLSARIDVDVLAADYEIVEPEIDWNRVINDGYLCKFWDGMEKPNVLCGIGFLSKFIEPKQTFIDRSGVNWAHCRPLQADEVKLVTDEKELWK